MKFKKNNIILLAILILEVVGLFVFVILFPSKIPLYPFNMFSAFQFSIGLFFIIFVISLYVLTTYFLATHEKYILIFFIVEIILLLPNFLFLKLFYIIFSFLIIYSVFPPTLMLLILVHLKIFEKQNALIKTMTITAMIFPLIKVEWFSIPLILSWLSFIF